ncbi:hypothetical protein [Nitrosomonas communis]|uniref:hypothetical protein n=1 Tax=Nitrosomonas communis TaxID=44574 RepID=UPI00147C70F0|nr:hypothetical protein [Nitrosomonas communis]
MRLIQRVLDGWDSIRVFGAYSRANCVSIPKLFSFRLPIAQAVGRQEELIKV